jgi:hypothetical protein
VAGAAPSPRPCAPRDGRADEPMSANRLLPWLIALAAAVVIVLLVALYFYTFG